MIAHKLIPGEKNFQWRAGEITRMEAFTDAVFAFAVTLLVVSLEVPRTFAELVNAMKGFAAFAICFALLVQVWYEHYVYSRRYGLQTLYTVFLNSVLLFVVLFYVYPLKFVFTLIIGQFSGGALATNRPEDMLQVQQAPILMLIYSLGFAAVFAVFALLYKHAYDQRRELGLNEYESLRTRHSIYNHLFMAGLGIIVAIFAMSLPVRYGGSAGFLYFTIPIYYTIAGTIFGKREIAALARTQAEASKTTQV